MSASALCAETDVNFVCPAHNGTRIVAWMHGVRMVRRDGLDRGQMLRDCLRMNVTLTTPKIYEGHKPHEDVLVGVLVLAWLAIWACALSCRRSNYRRL